MTNFVGKVFQSKDVAETGGNSCVVMGEDVFGITYAFIASNGVSVNVRPKEGFLSLWGVSDMALEPAAKHYMGVIETNPVNDSRAVEFFKSVLAGTPISSAPEISAPAAVEALPAVAPAVTPESVAPAPVFETVATAAAPAAEVVSPPAVVAPVTSVPVPVPAIVEKTVEAAPAVQPVTVQPQKEVARMTTPQTETILPADSEEDQAYSVRVTGTSVTVDMGKNRESRMGPDTYANHPQTIVNSNPEPTFYAGFNDKGVLVRVVSINDVDRKVVGAMIGGWVAECLSVSKVTLKDLAKHVGAARKVFEVKDKKGDAGQEPVAPSASDEE